MDKVNLLQRPNRMALQEYLHAEREATCRRVDRIEQQTHI